LVNKLKHNKCDQDDFDKECYELRQIMASLGKGGPVEIRAPSPKGPKVTAEDIERWDACA
jgi:hypothetical protein